MRAFLVGATIFVGWMGYLLMFDGQTPDTTETTMQWAQEISK